MKKNSKPEDGDARAKANRIAKANARKELRERSDRVTKNDVGDVLKKRKKVEAMASDGPLEEFLQDIKNLFSLVGDYWDGTYTTVSWGTIATIAGALVYVVSPIDLIPDFIPFIGLIDDAAVVGLCLSAVKAELADYLKWKKKKKSRKG